jgi:transposase
MSIAQLRHHFGVSRDTMTDWLWGLPTPEWTQRPNAKDDLHAQAIELRRKGCSVPDIATELGVSKSTAYLWTRHMPQDPTPEHAVERRRRHMQHMRETRWEPHRQARDAEQTSITGEAATWVGALSDREVLLLGAASYWCEGAKVKPWHKANYGLQFINSDAVLILLFVRLVEMLGRDRSSLRYRLSIHESADVGAATRSWAHEIGVSVEAFQRATIKTHNPSTVRKNVGDSYRGCLIVKVPKSSKLYWRVEGIVAGIARAQDRLMSPVDGT